MLQPPHIILKVTIHLPLIENPIYHVAAEQLQLDFVFEVALEFAVLVDFLEDVGGGGAVAQFEVLEFAVLDFGGQFVFEVFHADAGAGLQGLCVALGVLQLAFHGLLAEAVQQGAVFIRCWKLPPFGQSTPLETFRQFLLFHLIQQLLRVVQERPHNIIPNRYPLIQPNHHQRIRKEILGTLLQILQLPNLKAHRLDLPRNMPIPIVDGHLANGILPLVIVVLLFAAVDSGLFDHVILLNLFVVFAVLFEVDAVAGEQRMGAYGCETHSLATVKYEDIIKEIL
jgi:hypothetical protein